MQKIAVGVGDGSLQDQSLIDHNHYNRPLSLDQILKQQKVVVAVAAAAAASVVVMAVGFAAVANLGSCEPD